MITSPDHSPEQRGRASVRASILAALAVLLVGSTASAQSQYLICLDPGHGGSDPGACGCSLEEDAINLDTSLKLNSLLQAAGFRTVMTRSSDAAVSLSERSDYANAQGADRFVSIHSNAGGGTGIETYCHTSSTSSSNGWDLATKIQEEMVSAWPLPSRGMKQADFHVLRETNMPATLTELAFIDTCSPDADYLGSGSHRDEAAVAHLRAIQRHLGFAPGPITTTKGFAKGVIFEEKGVGTSDMSTRIPGATVRVSQTGASTTASSSGGWSFELDPGTYTITASAAGYQDGQVTCTVNANADSWCSFGLLPSGTAAKGFAKGVIFEDHGSGTADMSIKLEGVTVTVTQTGASLTTPATGAFSFELDAGTYTIHATKAGYQPADKTCTVNAGATAWCSFGLFPESTPPPTKGYAEGIVYIERGGGPSGATVLEGATVTLGSQSVTTSAGGAFRFEVDAGAHTVGATMSGYVSNQVPCTVFAGQTTKCDIGLYSEEGTARGIVFADRGNGSNEVRLSGATVKVIETGATATAGISGDWSFQLQAGTYAIQASAPGHDDGQVSCTVASGQTVDCPIGLHPTVTQPDAGNEEPDAGNVEPETDAGNVEQDAGTEPQADAGPAAMPEAPDGGCGCGTSGAEPAGLMLIALAGAALLRRRTGAALTVVGLFAVAGLSGCSEQQLTPPADEAAAVAKDTRALETEPFFAVGQQRVLATGEWNAPVLSPKGDEVAFTRLGNQGLFTVSTEGGAIRTLTEERGAGYAPIWDRDGSRIAYRHPGQPFDEVPLFSVGRDSKSATPFTLHQGVWALQREDRIILREGRNEQVVSEGNDRFFAPFISRDGQFVVYSGLTTGVWAYRRADGKRIHFGEGSWPTLSEDGRYLVFARTSDDGERLTASDLYLADLHDPSFRVARVALSPDLIETHPSFSSGRGLLVFSTADGEIRSVALSIKR